MLPFFEDTALHRIVSLPRAWSKSLAGPPLSRRLRVGRKPQGYCSWLSSRFQICCCHMQLAVRCSLSQILGSSIHVPIKNYSLHCFFFLICGSARGAMNFLLHQQVGCMHELSGHGAPAPSLFCPNLRYTLKDRVLYVLVIVCLAAEIILNRESQCWKAFAYSQGCVKGSAGFMNILAACLFWIPRMLQPAGHFFGPGKSTPFFH